MITPTRRDCQCRCDGGGGSYAVDDVLGIPSRYTRPLHKPVSRLAADVSFAATSEHLRAMLGVVVCAGAIRTPVESHGRAMAAFQPRDVGSGREFRTAPGEVEFTTDAGKVNTREDGRRDVKIGVFQKREAGTPVSLGDWDEPRLPPPTARLAFAEIAPPKAFRRCGRGWLQVLGVNHPADLSVLADGASWIGKSAQRTLTGCVETLDIFHACERLKPCPDRVFGEGTGGSHAGYERGRGLLLAPGWAGVCAWVGEFLGVEDVAERERRHKATAPLTASASASHEQRQSVVPLASVTSTDGDRVLATRTAPLARWPSCTVQERGQSHVGGIEFSAGCIFVMARKVPNGRPEQRGRSLPRGTER